jgi:GGDEF domain-containing protein
MSARSQTPTAVVITPAGEELPKYIAEWLVSRAFSVLNVADGDELMALALRGRPRIVVFDARRGADAPRGWCARMKRDSFTGVVPAVILANSSSEDLSAAFDAGADEVISDGAPEDQSRRRLESLLARSERDLGVHPSTRLPGAGAIEAEITRRLTGTDKFAVCYADLDHFKEYNDRYSYYEGDRVIRILAKLLHDVVKGICGEAGFIGHIGGDDFIFIIPVDAITETCEEITSTFDLLVPYQYSEHDRRAGYFFGKDRRGVLDRVPLMTLSIGVVTNAQRGVTEAAQISRLATEMKSYAKTLTGSVYSIDRRTDDRLPVDDTRHPSIHDASGGRG